MKKIKNIVAGCLASVLLCSTMTIGVSAAAPATPAIVSERTALDDLDAILAARFYLFSEEEDMNFWSDDLAGIQIIPLYNIDGDITAYYVELANDVGYAVINNNTNNPAAIEFGAGNNPKIKAILDDIAEPHIIYNSPVSLYNVDEATPLAVTSGTSGIYDNYPDLCEKNEYLAYALSQQKLILENSAIPYGNGNYGFFDFADLPSTDGYKRDFCVSWHSVDWLDMSEVSSDKVKDHCGATAVTNLALYFAELGKQSLLIGSKSEGDEYRTKTFAKVHEIVGNGPKVTIANDAVEYFSNRGVTLKYKTDRNLFMSDHIQAYKNAIWASHPCGLLLEDGIDSWHWILGVGWREYENNGMYFEVVNGWARNETKWYKPGNEATWISATEYWVE